MGMAFFLSAGEEQLTTPFYYGILIKDYYGQWYLYAHKSGKY